MALATKIINEVNFKYGDYENYFENDKGQILTQEQTTQYFKKYLEDLEF